MLGKKKKRKERKRLTCDKVKYRLRNQFEVCGAFFLGWVCSFATFRAICSRGMCKVKKNKLILPLQILKEFVYDVDSPWQKQKNQLESQDLGATGGVENITECLCGLSLVSFFKGFMENFHLI